MIRIDTDTTTLVTISVTGDIKPSVINNVNLVYNKLNTDASTTVEYAVTKYDCFAKTVTFSMFFTGGGEYLVNIYDKLTDIKIYTGLMYVTSQSMGDGLNGIKITL